MNRVYLRGCEAAYLGPVVRTSDFCDSRPPETVTFGDDDILTDTECINYGVKQDYHDTTSGNIISDERSKSEGIRRRSLVVHIRSGAMFREFNYHNAGGGQVRSLRLRL